MPNITLYRQRRFDGGLRTGIEVDGDLAYGLFEEGEDDRDPRLRWFVDLRCEGPKLPTSPRGARKWLLDQKELIGQGFSKYAEEIRAGIDADAFPFAWENFSNPPQDVTMKIVVTAIRRVDAIEMAKIVSEVGSRWEEIIRSLKLPHAALS